MATKLETIRGLIATKLAGLVDSNSVPLLQNVYEYATGPAGLSKYPVAVVLPTGGSTGEIKDTGRTLRIFSFEVFVYQEQSPSGKSPVDATATMTKVIDAALIAFDRDYTFNFEVSRVHVIAMSFDFNAQNGPYYIAKFKVECEVLVQNYE